MEKPSPVPSDPPGGSADFVGACDGNEPAVLEVAEQGIERPSRTPERDEPGRGVSRIQFKRVVRAGFRGMVAPGAGCRDVEYAENQSGKAGIAGRSDDACPDPVGVHREKEDGWRPVNELRFEWNMEEISPLRFFHRDSLLKCLFIFNGFERTKKIVAARRFPFPFGLEHRRSPPWLVGGLDGKSSGAPKKLCYTD
jgi:ribosome modulation factor